MTATMQMEHDFDDFRPGADVPARIARFAGGRLQALDPAGEAAAPRTPDWGALRARFAAIHALHFTLEANAAAALPAGGFLQAGEAVLTSCRTADPGVNHIYSANGKAAEAMILPVAASPTPGDRGLQ